MLPPNTAGFENGFSGLHRFWTTGSWLFEELHPVPINTTRQRGIHIAKKDKDSCFKDPKKLTLISDILLLL
jgi:nicotinamidase-related amidase